MNSTNETTQHVEQAEKSLTNDEKQIVNHLKKLVDSKRDLEQILPVFDELSDVVKLCNRLDAFEAVFILLPMLLTAFSANILLFGLCLMIAVHIGYISILDYYISNIRQFDVLKELKKVGGVWYATKCMQKCSKFEEGAPIMLRKLLSKYKVQYTVLSTEIHKKFLDMQSSHIQNVKKFLLAKQNEPQVLNKLFDEGQFDEEDRNFLISILFYDETLEELFQVRLKVIEEL